MAKHHPPEVVERLVAMVAAGTRTEEAAKALSVARRTASDWVKAAADDGRLESARLRLAPPESATPSPVLAFPTPAPAAAAQAPVTLPPRKVRQAILWGSLQRLTRTAGNTGEDVRSRIAADGTIGRIVESLERMMQDEAIFAEVEGEQLTAEEAADFKAWLERRRNPPSVADLDRELATLAAEVTA